MHHILLDVTSEDLHDALADYLIEFKDDDLALVFEDGKGGRVKTVADWELVVFETPDQTVCIFPVNEVMYEESEATPKSMVKAYREFVQEWKEHPQIVQRFQEHVAKHMDPELWIVELPALLIEDVRTELQTKQGPETVRVRSFVFKKEGVNNDVVRFDVRSVHMLCNSILDMDHLLDSLKPSAMVNVLMTVFEKEGKVVAIRVTKLRGGARAEIKGAYACSKGFGALIQNWTENLIREKETMIFPQVSATRRPVTFKLAAVPSAVGFWKHVGFQETGKLDKEKHAILEKRLYPEDATSFVATKRRPSASPGEITSKKRTRM